MTNDIYEEIFLNYGLTFISVDDLYNKIIPIRNAYLMLDKGVQRVYKWYFFCQLSIAKADDLKSAMWSYINSNDFEHKNNYIQVIEKYQDFCERRANLFKSKN